MSEAFVLEAKRRANVGKGASRRLRRLEGQIPAIIYGGSAEPTNITLDHDDLWHHLENEAFFSHIITINVDGGAEECLLKDLQRHPAKNIVLHADFLRVDRNQPVVVNVPLHFINEEECHGVKMEGGRIARQVNDVEVRCLPADLPEYIEVDMLNVNIGDVLHLSDITLPNGVESVALSHGEEHDLAVANVAAPKGSADEDEDAAADAGDDASAGDDAGADGADGDDD